MKSLIMQGDGISTSKPWHIHEVDAGTSLPQSLKGRAGAAPLEEIKRGHNLLRNEKGSLKGRCLIPDCTNQDKGEWFYPQKPPSYCSLRSCSSAAGSALGLEGEGGEWGLLLTPPRDTWQSQGRKLSCTRSPQTRWPAASGRHVARGAGGAVGNANQCWPRPEQRWGHCLRRLLLALETCRKPLFPPGICIF